MQIWLQNFFPWGVCHSLEGTGKFVTKTVTFLNTSAAEINREVKDLQALKEKKRDWFTHDTWPRFEEGLVFDHYKDSLIQAAEIA